MLLRWLDQFNVAHDLWIDPGPDGGYRLRTRSTVSIAPSVGAVSAIPIGGSANLLNFIAPSDYYLRGFNVTGQTDGLFGLTVNGTLVASEKLTPIVRVVNFTFPGYLFVPAGQSIVLSVTNTGVIPSDYNGSLYREI
jgi:hypothetical protein